MPHKIATVQQLKAVPIQDCGEPLVSLNECSSHLLCRYMRAGSGLQGILVRASVSEKLIRVEKTLQEINPAYALLIADGYRSLPYQEEYFLSEFLKKVREMQGKTIGEIIEATHLFVALPSVAGHPTGGAIDLTIAQDGVELDMGGAIADFTRPELLPTHSPHATSAQKKLRLTLHDAMIKEGFAPFYGEWWHFSYGDREWAAFYNRPRAPYAPLSF